MSRLHGARLLGREQIGSSRSKASRTSASLRPPIDCRAIRQVRTITSGERSKARTCSITALNIGRRRNAASGPFGCASRCTVLFSAVDSSALSAPFERK
jgi:hypothetical protein